MALWDGGGAQPSWRQPVDWRNPFQIPVQYQQQQAAWRDELEATLQKEYADQWVQDHQQRQWAEAREAARHRAIWQAEPQPQQWLPTIWKEPSTPQAPDFSREATEQYRRQVFQEYGFTPAAIQELYSVPMMVPGRNTGGGRGRYHPPIPLVRPRGGMSLPGYQDGIALHEMAHAYSIGGEKASIQWNLPFSGWGAPQEFLDDWARLQNEVDPRYARARELSHDDYINSNNAERYAGLIGGVMGDLSQLPPYMWKHYRGLLERGAPYMPMIWKNAWAAPGQARPQTAGWSW